MTFILEHLGADLRKLHDLLLIPEGSLKILPQMPMAMLTPF